MAAVMVVGSNGLIGSAVVHALEAAGHEVLRVSRSGGEATASIDITEPGELIIDHVDSVVHAASYVGNDAAESHRINVQGTLKLTQAAAAAGVGRVVYLSTAAVYGYGPHRRLRSGQAHLQPSSIRSQHRLDAEGIVLAAGGAVVRPHLVYGRRDQWVIPGLFKLSGPSRVLPGDGASLTSVVSVISLGQAVAVLATEVPDVHVQGRVHHAVQPDPISIRELVDSAAAQIGHDPIGFTGRSPTASAPTSAARALNMLTTDHWFAEEGLWTLAGVDPPSGLALGEPDCAWYREKLT